MFVTEICIVENYSRIPQGSILNFDLYVAHLKRISKVLKPSNTQFYLHNYAYWSATRQCIRFFYLYVANYKHIR